MGKKPSNARHDYQSGRARSRHDTTARAGAGGPGRLPMGSAEDGTAESPAERTTDPGRPCGAVGQQVDQAPAAAVAAPAAASATAGAAAAGAAAAGAAAFWAACMMEGITMLLSRSMACPAPN